MIGNKIKISISTNIVNLFQEKNYETYILEMINSSSIVFKNQFIQIKQQSNSEADFVDTSGNIYLDVKLPFEPGQVGMLTDGYKHGPMIKEWLMQLADEASHMDIEELRNGTYDATKSKLYKIMFNQISREIEKERIHKKEYKENIVFFMPFLVGHSFKGIIACSSDFLDLVFEQLVNEIEGMADREIFTISPSGFESEFVLRNLNTREREYIDYTRLNDFFSYEHVKLELL